ncbi:hypothetical protein AB0G49_20695 [Streptomyces longwoodensis]|uniref:hypothetical protein n=1 Tax=Streptomyces longwoodensis TaxID=68231 RepID=UPI0033EFED70
MSAEAVGALVAGLALALNAWSMFYLARQTRTATRQTVVAVEQAKVSNAVAAAAANDTVLRSLREVHAMMLQHEGMRAYFYSDKPLPGDGPERDQVLTLGELLADVLASGVHVHERIPDSQSAGPWADYCRHTIRSSPVLRHLLHEHPSWWPTLLSALPDQAPNAGLRGVPPQAPAS